MGVDHMGVEGLRQELDELRREVRRLSRATLQHGSIGRAGLRFYDDGEILIEGATSDVVIGHDEHGNGVVAVGPARLRVNAGVVSLANGVSSVSAGGNFSEIAAGARRLQVNPDGLFVWGTDSVPTLPEGASWVARLPTGELVTVPAGSGGPGGTGEFSWPFPLSVVSREYGPHPDYPSGVHPGIDFSGGPAVLGAPTPASAAGTVEANGWDDERGWYVILNHGSRPAGVITTRYYHLRFQSPLPVSSTVAKGQSVGPLGSTGFSTGPHCHFETWISGVHMDPRVFMSTYGDGESLS